MMLVVMMKSSPLGTGLRPTIHFTTLMTQVTGTILIQGTKLLSQYAVVSVYDLG